MLALFGFTIRQLLGQRKLWLTAAVLLFPALIVVLVRAVSGEPPSGERWEIYHVLMQFVLITLLVPLVCLLHGTALVGAEIEQRTLVYLTTRRLHRATVLLVRFAATWAALSMLFMLAMLILHLCVTVHAEVTTLVSTGIVWKPWLDLCGYLIIAPAGAAGYLVVFTTISLLFRRPLLVSAIYFIVFELILGNLPVLARRLSISHPLRQTIVHAIPGARRFYELPADIGDLVYPADQTGTWTLLAIVVVLLVVACTFMTVRELGPSRASRD